MMGYGNCDARRAGKDNRVRSGCHGFRTVSESLWLILQKSVVLSRVGSVMEYVGIIMASFRRYWVMDG